MWKSERLDGNVVFHRLIGLRILVIFKHVHSYAEELKMSRRKINFQGQVRDAISVDFEADKETFSTYILHDGSSLKIKAVLTEVMRVEDVYAPNGDPVYLIQAAQVMSVSAPDSLRKTP